MSMECPAGFNQLSNVLVFQTSSSRIPSSMRASSGSFSGGSFDMSLVGSMKLFMIKGWSMSMPKTVNSRAPIRNFRRAVPPP